jgi:mannose/fructose/N-acetylgalactosamine-specific phosphotransferase system component IIB
MQFRTAIPIKPANISISHQDKMLSVGSCFADTMGLRLQTYKFDILTNPFGNIFNPISIFQLLSHKNSVDDSNFVQQHDIWYNFQLHSEISDPCKQKLIAKINQIEENVANYLTKSSYLILTLGTAWVYQIKTNQIIVANCHKVPAQNFEKRLIQLTEIEAAFEVFYQYLKAINPNLQIIFTVSPVRHIKDTIELNSVSKSILRLFCHQMAEKHQNIHYFPAFELMMDDLRDYRFYEKDMIHPNEIAQDYIWAFFTDTWMKKGTQKICADWGNILKSLAHKPYYPQTEIYRQFLKDTLQKIQGFEAIFDISNEVRYIEQKLKE